MWVYLYHVHDWQDFKAETGKAINTVSSLLPLKWEPTSPIHYDCGLKAAFYHAFYRTHCKHIRQNPLL